MPSDRAVNSQLTLFLFLYIPPANQYFSSSFVILISCIPSSYYNCLYPLPYLSCFCIPLILFSIFRSDYQTYWSLLLKKVLRVTRLRCKNAQNYSLIAFLSKSGRDAVFIILFKGSCSLTSKGKCYSIEVYRVYIGQCLQVNVYRVLQRGKTECHALWW